MFPCIAFNCEMIASGMDVKCYIIIWMLLSELDGFHTASKHNPSLYTLPTESVFKLGFQPEFGIQLGIPIQIGINLGECSVPHQCSLFGKSHKCLFPK